MKNINTLERDRLNKENERISHILSLCKDDGLDFVTRQELNKRLKISKITIGNLPETIRIEIAKHINLLMNGINESLKFDEFKNLFENDMDAYLNRVCSLVVKNNKYIAERQSGYNLDIQRAILFFDFTRDEFLHIASMSRDEAVTFINNKYGTSIPMSSELIDAKTRWQESRSDLEQIENAKELKILGVRNGAYVQTEYPLSYERDVIKHYNELIVSHKKSLKRK